MIIFKVALTALLLITVLAVFAVFIDSLTDFRFWWLHELAEAIIGVFLYALATALAAGFIYVCGLIIYEIWTQL